MAKTKPGTTKGQTTINRVKGGKNIRKIMSASAPRGTGTPSPQINHHKSVTPVTNPQNRKGRGLSK